MTIPRESCVLCACKHLAQARVLLLECMHGYAQHYWFAMGHMAEAEDELAKDHPTLADTVRAHRLCLQSDEHYEVPFSKLILHVAKVGQAEVEQKVADIEAEVEGMSTEELSRWWREIRR